MTLSHRLFTCGLAATFALPVVVSQAAQPVRVLDRLGFALQQIVPAPDGALGVVSASEVDVLTRTGKAGWRSQVIAVDSDPRMFASAWMAEDRWWLVRQDSLNREHTLWDLNLVGPVQAGSGKPKPASVAATLARRCESIDARQVVRDPRGRQWLVMVTGVQVGDPGALKAFDSRGVSDRHFDDAAARSLGALAPVAATAAAAGGWWLSVSDGASLHERTTLLALGPDGALATRFGTGGRVALDASNSGLPEDAQVSVHNLFDDDAGTLWTTVLLRDSRRVAAAPRQARRDELRAFSTVTGLRQPEAEPPQALMQELWSDAVTSDHSWSGFVSNAGSPTLCVAAEQLAAHAWVLRCIGRRGNAWQSVGEPALLAGIDSVGDVVADPRDPGQLLIGADEGRRGVTLYAWKP